MFLLPATAFYASILALIYLYLTALVIQCRRQYQVGIGDGGNEDLQLLIRVHGNFVEYVPLTLILLAILELNSQSAVLAHVLGMGLVVGRVLHAYGLRQSAGVTWQRFLGMLLTLLTLFSIASINLTLIYWMPFL